MHQLRSMLKGPIHDRPVPPSRLGDWADWCFLPLAGTYAIVSKGSRSAATFPTRLSLVGILADMPLGDYKLQTGQTCGLVGSEIEDCPGDLLRGRELVRG